MGYCMTQRDSDFFIAYEDKVKANNCISQDDYYFTHPDLERTLEEYGWEALSDKEGNIISIYFSGDKLTDQEELLRIIAPFVKFGSFIEMDGEDGTRWRWIFDGKTCKEIYPTVSWDKE